MHFFLLDYFHPRNYGFVSCLPLTEHVQSLYWACADIIDPVCDRFDGWLWLWLNSNRDIDSWVLHTFQNTQLAIEALLPLFYSHICNFARYDDSKCYITCRWVWEEGLYFNVEDFIDANNFEWQWRTAKTKLAFLCNVKSLWKTLLSIVLNTKASNVYDSWTERFSSPFHQCAMIVSISNRYHSGKCQQVLPMRGCRRCHRWQLFRWQSGIQLFTNTDCGFGLWKYCTVSRYCFDISTPGLKEWENVFSNTLNTPHLDFSYKAILPDLHHLQWSLIRLSNYLHGIFFHNAILLIDISNSA